MTSEVFPVEKSQIVYGQASFQLKGKRYNEIMAGMTSYLQKIAQTKLKVAKMVPTDKDQAYAAYLTLRTELLKRNSSSYIPDPNQEFEDKMLILQYARTIDGDFVGKTFGFIYEFGPLDYLEQDYTSYNTFVGHTVQSFYLHDNRLRKKKIVSITHDYCRDLAVSLTQDPDWNSGTARNAYDLVFRCYDSFPFHRDASEKIFDLMIFMADFYVFSNFTTNGAGTAKFLTLLREQELQFDSSLRFFAFMTRAYNQLNDAHVSLTMECYNQFIFIQPIHLQIIADGHERRGFERFVITKANSPTLKKWEGYYVAYIDGMDPYKAFYSYVNSLGRSHEPRVRLVFGVSKMVWDSTARDFRLERGMFLKRTEIPDRPFVVYAIQKPDSNFVFEIKVDWMVFKDSALQGFNSQYSYWKKHCVALPFVKKDTVPAAPNNLQKRNPIDRNHQMKPQSKSTHHSLIKRSEDDGNPLNPTCEGITPIAIGPGFAFFIMSDPVDGDYGVLIIQTFDVTDMESWFKNMRKGFLKLMEKGIKKLLLDLSSNYGGVLCLAYTLLGVLSPSAEYPFPATKLTFGTRAIPNEKVLTFSKCVDEAGLKISPFKLQSFSNMTDHCEFPSTATWSTGAEVKAKIVGGFGSGYTKFSPFLMDKCNFKYSYLLEDVKPEFDPIIVVTDGTCGSSCAIVALYFQVNNSPNILVFSAVTTAIGWLNPNIYSFAGGQVVSFDNVKDVAKRSSCYYSIPKAMERVRATMTYRAIFNKEDKNFPLEFYVSPATAALRFTNDVASSVSSRWKEAFSLGMEIKRNPDKFFANLTDFVLVGGIGAS